MIDLSKLNQQQRLAVETTEGQVLILAGAGSGKTNTLMHRIAYILDQGKAEPEELLVVTFTNKAAKEMKERIARLLETKARIPWMGTFHSICAKMLRQDGFRLGYTPSFTIYDTDDQQALIKQVMEKLNISIKELKPSVVQNFISSAKNELVSPEQYTANAQGYFQQLVAGIYPLYQQGLKENNAVDFDDLIMQTTILLKNYEDVRRHYQQMFKYIMVDEYQDTNHAQYLLISILAQGHLNLACVGDDDQSIYAFRGATIRNILEFERDYPNTAIIKLEQNYRSTQTILNASFQVVSRNKDRKDKKLWTENGEGTQITLYTAENEKDEGHWIAMRVDEMLNEAINLNDIAVLYRTNAQSRALEEQFLRAGLNYRVVGGTKFYDRKEIKDILAYLRILYNPKDNGSVRRIINVPRRGIGPKAIEDVANAAASMGLSIVEYLQANEVSGSTKSFAELLRNLAKLAEEQNVVELLNSIIEYSGYLKMLKDGTSENESRIENIKELISVAAKFGELPPATSISEFLNEVSLFQDANEDLDEPAVTLMTIHAAKGLEFAEVFVVGMEEGLFPHSRVYTDPRELSEERRLAYVAITRAKKHLYLTHAASRTYFGKSQVNQLSRFVEDIDQALLNKVAYAGRSLNSWDDDSWGSFNDDSSSVAETTKPKLNLSVGDKVKHDYFGIGTIRKLGDGKAEISFGPIYGVKELVLEYAPLTKI